MAKKDSFGEFIISALAVIGGAVIVSEIAKSVGKKEVYYSCPNCKNDIKYGETECPNCHVHLTWGAETILKNG